MSQKNGTPKLPPRAARIEPTDWERLRHGRDRHSGFRFGHFLQPAPMLFSRDGHNIFLADMYRGRSAFLILGGPSLNQLDLGQLDQRGVVTCAVNNAATVYRPQLWVSVDDPGNFSDAIWTDAGITKFVPLCHMEKRFMTRDSAGDLIESEQRVGEMPAVFGFRRNDTFNADQWLHEDTFNWGNHGKLTDALGNTGSRSVMLVALRLLYYLGIRDVFLLGCDFRMKYGQANYAFEQDRSRSSVDGNNSTYQILNSRLKALQPHFEREDYHVFNCYEESGLTAFPYLPFNEAVSRATRGVPSVINTSGMYDRRARESAHNRMGGFELDTDAVTRSIDLSQLKRDLPSLTLVTYVGSESRDIFPYTWATWHAFQPWLSGLPTIVLYDEPLEQYLGQLKRLTRNTSATWQAVATGSVQNPRDRWSQPLLRTCAQRVQTPWYVIVEPEAIGCPSESLLDPQWFSANEERRTPVLIASPWSYTKPVDQIKRLDEWANEIPELHGYPPLDLPIADGADRVQHQTLSGWCLFGQTKWTRQVASYAREQLPCRALDTYLSYCAARRRERVVLRRLKEYGWDHSFARRDRIATRCAKLLATRAEPIKVTLS